jgi:hypothetical protein
VLINPSPFPGKICACEVVVDVVIVGWDLVLRPKDEQTKLHAIELQEVKERRAWETLGEGTIRYDDKASRPSHVRGVSRGLCLCFPV